jgi:hypothetical protein
MKVYLLGNKKNTLDMLDYVEDIRFAATKWGGVWMEDIRQAIPCPHVLQPIHKVEWNKSEIVAAPHYPLHLDPLNIGNREQQSPPPFQTEGRVPGPQDPWGRQRRQKR